MKICWWIINCLAGAAVFSAPVGSVAGQRDYHYSMYNKRKFEEVGRGLKLASDVWVKSCSDCATLVHKSYSTILVAVFRPVGSLQMINLPLNLYSSAAQEVVWVVSLWSWTEPTNQGFHFCALFSHLVDVMWQKTATTCRPLMLHVHVHSCAAFFLFIWKRVMYCIPPTPFCHRLNWFGGQSVWGGDQNLQWNTGLGSGLETVTKMVDFVTKISVAIAKLCIDFTQTSYPDRKC